MLRIVITYGTVAVGTTTTARVCLKNEELHDVNYTFAYPCNKLNLDYVFKVDFPKRVTLKPGRCYEFCVSFSPTIAGQDYIDYYTIDDKEFHKKVNLTVQGTSTGPRISFNPEEILFLPTDNEIYKFKKNIKLTNNSMTMGYFKWFINPGGQGPFKISKQCGIIEPFQSMNYSVVFNESFHGTFVEELVCLIHHQEPLMLRVRGTRSNLGVTVIEEEEILKSECNFSTVMEDTVNVRSDIPIVSVSSTFIDFGLGSASDVTWNITQPLNISNHLDEDGTIFWYQDSEETFTITPEHLTIEAKGVKDFAVKFRPRHSERRYSTILFGVFMTTKNGKLQNAQHTFRIPVIGHTCSGPYPLKPKCRLAEKIFFPPTVPLSATFTTFMLNNCGNTPILYKFIPPENSHVTMMPMCGLIEPENWAIILAALHPTCSGFYIEEWKVIIDSTTELKFKLYGSADTIQYSVTIQNQLDLLGGNNKYLSKEELIYPSLYEDNDTVSDVHSRIINNSQDIRMKKEIAFDVTSPGSESKSVILVQNLTRNYLHIRLLGNMDWVYADGGEEVIIRPNEVNPFCLVFKPAFPGIYNSVITFSAIALRKGKPIGVPLDTSLSVNGHCSVFELQVLPKSIDLGQLECDQKVETKFSLINTGTCPLHFQLNPVQRNLRCEIVEINQIKLQPNRGTLLGGNYCNINISFIPEIRDDFYVKIFCVLRKNMSSDIATSTEPNNLMIFHFHFEGIYPTFQVYGIQSIQCSKKFSEVMLWQMLNIDQLNTALKKVALDSAIRIDMEVPASQVNSCPTQLGLVLKGKYSALCNFSLTRSKLCTCPLLRQSRKMTFVEHVYKCPHRSILQLCPKNGAINKKKIFLLKLEIKYCLTGEHQLAYDLTLLPIKRNIILYFNIKVTEEVSTWLWPLYHTDEWDELKEHEKSTFYLNAGKVYIGSHDPVFRWFILHNTIAEVVKWQLLKANTSPFAVIRCVTGKSGALPDHPLCVMFSFKPMESIHYEEKFMGILNYRKVFIVVHGEGTTSPSVNPPICMPNNILQQKRYLPTANMVNISKDHFIIENLTTNRKVTRMFAINNTTSQVIRLTWNKLILPCSLKCFITPDKEHVIQPNERKWLLLNICAENLPTHVTHQMRCDLLDLTERRYIKKNRDSYKKYEEFKCEQSCETCCIEEVQINKNLEKKCVYLTLSINTISPRDAFDPTKASDAYFWHPCQKEPAFKRCRYIMQMKYATYIMEKLIWSALNCEIIKEKLMNLNNSNNPTYMQFVMAPNEKSQPSLDNRNISDIFDRLIFETLQKYTKQKE